MAEESEPRDDGRPPRADDDGPPAGEDELGTGSYPAPELPPGDDGSDAEHRPSRPAATDDSDEVRGPRFSATGVSAPGAEEGGDEELQSAYESLQIRTPLEEFETYAQARLDTLVRLGDSERAALTSDAIELGREALQRAMGAKPRGEAP